MKAPAEAATALPWLAPGAASLVTLARSPPATAWAGLRSDPGAVLLVLRQGGAALSVPGLSFFPALLHDPAVLDGALRSLDQGDVGFVNWPRSPARPVYEACLNYARVAQRIAECTGKADAENAWVAGLLAPLGWLAVSAAAPAQAAECLKDAALSCRPAATQQRHWGLDQAAIARRLAWSWRPPPWLTAVAGHLGLPVETALALGADRSLVLLLQLTTGLVQRSVKGLCLTVGASPAEALDALGLPAADLRILEQEALGLLAEPANPPADWASPAGQPLLRDLLAVAAENRRLRDEPRVARLQSEVDDLHQALEEQRAGEAERLQARKLSALAEFAAGAGHEINNPLAVISGQAQYLVSHEPEPARQRALHTIIGQTQRIHQILNDLMQFARPPRPQKQLLDLPALVGEVALSLGELANQRHVRLTCPELSYPINVLADPRQVRTALAALVRNAVEAAALGETKPPEVPRWVAVRLETPGADLVDVIVEDSGDGPKPALREHLFDPFYSGRSAGRGRGMGLPTAWRLAREQGGDVRFHDVPEGPTRFVLRLPRENLNGTSRGPVPVLCSLHQPATDHDPRTTGAASA